RNIESSCRSNFRTIRGSFRWLYQMGCGCSQTLPPSSITEDLTSSATPSSMSTASLRSENSVFRTYEHDLQTVGRMVGKERHALGGSSILNRPSGKQHGIINHDATARGAVAFT